MKRILKFLITAVFVLLITASSFSVCAEDTPLVSREDFLWGVNRHSNFYHLYGDINLEEQIHLMADMGAKIMRININTEDIASTDKTVKLCNAYGIKVMIIMGCVRTMGENNDTDYEYRMMNFFADRYNGKNGFGKVDFFQLDNEVDSYYYDQFGHNGYDYMEAYDIDFLKELASNFNNLSKAVRDADTDASVVINHNGKFPQFIDYLCNFNVDFDIIGIDWYSAMSEKLISHGQTPFARAKMLYDEYKKDIIICETNLTSNQDRDENDVSNWDILIDIMNEAYSYPFVKGCIVYELCDEPYLEDVGSFNGEAHFGIINADRYGTMYEPKPIYYRLKNLWGGKDTKEITIEKAMSLNTKEIKDYKNNCQVLVAIISIIIIAIYTAVIIILKRKN